MEFAVQVRPPPQLPMMAHGEEQTAVSSFWTHQAGHTPDDRGVIYRHKLYGLHTLDVWNRDLSLVQINHGLYGVTAIKVVDPARRQIGPRTLAKAGRDFYALIPVWIVRPCPKGPVQLI
eukprot:TRINITY_DN498_c0_g1_i6.p6 TRINITY_DN498_c0_g1~~TRINITY_DN498_c0_g1_i6.p6  ORF type:complete len:119 (-),score=2.67 TRINITY_DN498_c0_g1_i6:2129-2485(-)